MATKICRQRSSRVWSSYSGYGRGSDVFKIDGDSQVIARGISELAWSTQYAGHVMTRTEDHCINRCRHIGKCRDREMTPYRRRYRGSYAAGASYYLVPIAIDTAVKDYFRYRDEFDIELFEDKAIGSILGQNGIERHSVDIAALLGLRIDELGRLFVGRAPRDGGDRHEG